MTHPPVKVWKVKLSDGDWYFVFARSAQEALGIVRSTHYDDMRPAEFKQQYSPIVSVLPDTEKILVNDEERGQRFRTAKQWAKGEKPGPFVSNTYEW